MTRAQASSSFDDYVSREMNQSRPRYRETTRAGQATRHMRSDESIVRAMMMTRKLRKGKRAKR